jgi:hypothetical protein
MNVKSCFDSFAKEHSNIFDMVYYIETHRKY